MPYATTNLPRLISSGIAGKGKIWFYESTDAATTVDASGYITNAKALGMTVGDLVLAADTDATPYTVTTHVVTAILANGSANLSNAGATHGTDSD